MLVHSPGLHFDFFDFWVMTRLGSLGHSTQCPLVNFHTEKWSTELAKYARTVSIKMTQVSKLK